MAKKAGEIAPFKILARIHFNLQVAVCPAKIWSVLCTYHNYINPNKHSVKKLLKKIKEQDKKIRSLE